MKSRTRHYSSLFFSAAVFAALLLGGCSGGWDWPSAGSSSPAAADNMGSSPVLVYGSDEQPLDTGTVRLIPVSYHSPSPYSSENPDSSNVYTSFVRDGFYSFDIVDSGVYNLEAENPGGYKVRVESLQISSAGTEFPACTLKEAGSVNGLIADSAGPVPENAFVYIPGSLYSTFADSGGIFSFYNLPDGDYRIKVDYIPELDTRSDIIIDDTAKVTEPVPQADTVIAPNLIVYNFTMSVGAGYDSLAAEADSSARDDKFTIQPGDTTDVYITVEE